jgi:hypothetical protein
MDGSELAIHGTGYLLGGNDRLFASVANQASKSYFKSVMHLYLSTRVTCSSIPLKNLGGQSKTLSQQ